MHLLKNKWSVKHIPIKMAKPFVNKWHYAHGTSVTAVSVFGLFFNGDSTLHGVSWWMPPPLGAAKSISDDHSSVLSLSRFCLRNDRPENAGSFLISKSIKMLDKRWKKLLTYADTAFKHTGGLYRASNWDYAGLTKKNPMYYDPINERIVSRKKGPNTFNKKQMIEKGFVYKGSFEKHRFVYPLFNRSRVRYNDFELFFTENGKIKGNKK